MQPIQINVSVTIGVSQELKGLLLPLVAQLPPVEVPEPKPAKKKAQPAVETKPAEEPAPAEDPKPAETEQPAEQPAKEYTEVDVRAAMDAVRRRIEGEGWKENPTSEGYKKWHRVLTAWFKTTATECGAEKPSALPDSESRRKFIACCEAVFVNDAGELVSDLPQF